jgi:hypothetical protein
LFAEYPFRERIISTKTSQKQGLKPASFATKACKSEPFLTKTYKRADNCNTNTDKQPTKYYDVNVLQL